jgi:hypothetical protein
VISEVRYYVALALTVVLPPVLLYWLVIHPFVPFWRRVGPLVTYTAVLVVVSTGMVLLFLWRKTLLAVEFGSQPLLIAIGLMGLIGSARLRFLLGRHFGFRELAGLPEVSSHRHPGRLVTEGIYGRIRHPRYVELCCAFFSWALMANYLASYLVVACWIPGVYLIVRLEERELRRRFGSTYEAYCRRVPRFIPKRGSG